MIFDTTCTVEDTRRAHRSSCSESGLILAGEVGWKVWADQAARSRLEKKPFVSASLVAVESLPPWTIGERILKHFLSWFWVKRVTCALMVDITLLHLSGTVHNHIEIFSAFSAPTFRRLFSCFFNDSWCVTEEVTWGPIGPLANRKFLNCRSC